MSLPPPTLCMHMITLPNPFPANTTPSDPIAITTPCEKYYVLVNTVVMYLISIIHTVDPIQGIDRAWALSNY